MTNTPKDKHDWSTCEKPECLVIYQENFSGHLEHISSLWPVEKWVTLQNVDGEWVVIYEEYVD